MGLMMKFDGFLGSKGLASAGLGDSIKGVFKYGFEYVSNKGVLKYRVQGWVMDSVFLPLVFLLAGYQISVFAYRFLVSLMRLWLSRNQLSRSTNLLWSICSIGMPVDFVSFLENSSLQKI